MKAIDAIMPSPREVQQRCRDFQEAIRPITRQQVHLHCLARPTWLHHADGRIEMVDDGLTPEMRECMAQLEQMKESVARSFGFGQSDGMLQITPPVHPGDDFTFRHIPAAETRL